MKEKLKLMAGRSQEGDRGRHRDTHVFLQYVYLCVSELTLVSLSSSRVSSLF